MNKIITTIIFTFFSLTLFAQNIPSKGVIVSGNLYNKQTGQKLTEEETSNLIKNTPILYLNTCITSMEW